MRGLYAIVDPSACLGRDPRVVAAAILRGGAAILQLRAKSLPDRELAALARELAALCAHHGVPFVVNDRPDLAKLVGATLHLGQDDLPIESARAFLGDDRAIGLSTHSLAQAEDAVRRGASMIGFGPVFDTTTKERPDPVVGVAALAEVCRAAPIPVVAIGGLTLARAPAIRDAGAAMGACIGALCGADDPEAAARALHASLGGRA